MIDGFNELESTKVGVKTEEMVRKWLEDREWTIEEAPNIIKHDNRKDFTVSKGALRRTIEVKGDDYPQGNNIALEHKQQSLRGKMLPSGMSVTESEYVFYYVFRWSKLFIFTVENYNHYLNQGYINQEDSKTCNNASSTGKTECYVLNAGNLESDGFFFQIVENVS